MALKNPCLMIFFLLIIWQDVAFSQTSNPDSVNITLPEADSLFLLKNQAIIAEKFNIDAARAQIIQARVFINPTLNLTQNIYNPERKTWFEATDAGESSASIQKLFLLAGKRNKKISLASLNYEKEEHSYFDLLRTLKLNLHSSFYSLYFLNKSLKVYDREIASMSALIGVFERQLLNGYVSKKEVLRLKAGLFSLENEKLGLLSQYSALQSDLNVLMHTVNTKFIPNITEPEGKRSIDSLRLQALIDSAFSYRYDLKSAQWDVKISEANLRYQKALAVPDLTLSMGWDRNGSFIHNYNYLGLQIDLPFFDRNQGNIKTARFTNESMKAHLVSEEDQVRADVIQAYSVLLENEKLYKKFDTNFIGDFEALITELIHNYEKKNIGLLEFLDFYEAYKQNQVQFNNLRNSRMKQLPFY